MKGPYPSQQISCPAEILLIIFEEVYVAAPASLRGLRLVSRHFNVLVDPIVYRHVRLTEVFVSCFKDTELDDSPKDLDARRRVERAICTFTRQVTVDKALDWSLVVKILLSLNTFHHLHLSCWNGNGTSSRRINHWSQSDPIPQSVLNCVARYWPSAKLSVTELIPRLDHIDEFNSLTNTNLVSLKLQAVSRHQFRRIEGTLKTFLLQCNQLEVLHLPNLQSGTRFLDEEIRENIRLPAIEELFLQDYFWLHSPSIATNFWNWSKLTTLRLEKVFIINFLNSVPPENLQQLRSLVTDGHCESAVDNTKVSGLPAI